MSIRHIILIPFLIVFASLANAQTSTTKVYNNKENMPSNTLPAHKWWNLLHYTIDITPDYNTRFITGTNSIKFIALQTGNEMHIDLYDPMRITSITWKNSPVEFKKVKDTYIITFPEFLKKAEQKLLRFILKVIRRLPLTLRLIMAGYGQRIKKEDLG